MAGTLHALIALGVPPERVARALIQVPWTDPDVWALVVPEPHAGGVAAVIVDPHGALLTRDLHDAARACSSQDYPICVANTGETPRWTRYQGHEIVADFDSGDDLFYPVDDDGFPELQVTPVARRDGPPADWQVFRPCLDRGMDALFSCRFRPLERTLARAIDGSSPDVRAFVLRQGGRALDRPAEVGWPSARDR